MADQTIRILIADDHTVVRKGLKALILTEPNLEVVGEAADGEEAVRRARIVKPDVILMDMSMPNKDGVEAIQEIKAEDPNARILVLTSFAEDKKILAAIKAGALGYLLKDASPDELLRAIQDVFLGKSSLHPTVAQKVISAIQQPSQEKTAGESDLTDREIEILKLIAEGLPNQQIAKQLYISERTVRTHVSNILRKLNLPNRTQAALYAVREGLVSTDD
jgi:NarL family two-component system response regulator LiaR